MTAGARGAFKESAKARWTLGTARRSAGPSIIAIIAIIAIDLRCVRSVFILSSKRLSVLSAH